MAYKLLFTRDARDEQRRLQKNIGQRIMSELKRHAANAEVVPHVRLKHGEYAGLFRLYIGPRNAYRAIYRLDHENTRFIVVEVILRRDAYRR